MKLKTIPEFHYLNCRSFLQRACKLKEEIIKICLWDYKKLLQHSCGYRRIRNFLIKINNIFFMSGNNCFIRLLEDKNFCFFNKKLNTQNIAHLKKTFKILNFELFCFLDVRNFFLSSNFSLKSRMNFYHEIDFKKWCAFTFFVVTLRKYFLVEIAP